MIGLLHKRCFVQPKALQGGQTGLLFVFAILASIALATVSSVVDGWNDRKAKPAESKLQFLAYTSDYQNLYGPLSAGPGHLPCPDTDYYTVPDAASFNKAGPNPPCGAGDFAVGWLPKKIQLDDSAFIFASTEALRLWYVVSTRFINNPINRIVNLSTLESRSDQPAAYLIKFPVNYDHRRSLQLLTKLSANETLLSAGLSELSGAVIVTLYPHDFLPTAAHQVAGWAMQQLNSAAIARCENVSRLCRPYEVPCSQAEAAAELMTDVNFLKWLDQNSLIGVCSDTAGIDYDSLGLPRRHWFFRNRWHESLTLHIDPACSQAKLEQCHFQVAHKVSNSLAEVQINLIPVPSES